MNPHGLALVFIVVLVLLPVMTVAQLPDLKSPVFSDTFIQKSQNIPQTNDNDLDEIYFKILTFQVIDPTLSALPQEERDRFIGILQSFQNRNGGFGDWKRDRSKIGSTRRVLEVLDVLGGEPLNRTALIGFIQKLQMFNLSFGNFGFKSYLKDTDADVSATYNAVKALTLLGVDIPNRDGVILYLKNHQNTDGGFGLQTNREEGIIWISTALHTHRGVQALTLLSEKPEFNAEAITFLQSLQTANGGFSSHPLRTTGTTADTFDAIRALKSLGSSPLKPTDAVIFLKNNQKPNGGFVENSLDTREGPHSTYWGMAALKDLGEPVAGNNAYDFSSAFTTLKNDGGFGNRPGSGSNIRFTFDAVFSLNLIGKHPLDTQAAITYILDQKNPDGGFGVNGISSTKSTYRSVYSLILLGVPVPGKDEIITYLQSAQNADGGFGWSTQSVSRGSNTFRSIKAFTLLGSSPPNTEKIIGFLHDLQNPDGGFGDFNGDQSDLGSTYRAIAALDFLGAGPVNRNTAIAFIRNSQNSDGGFKRSANAITAPENFSLAVYTYDAVQALTILGQSLGNKSHIYDFVIELRNPDFGYGQQAFYTSEVSNTFISLFTSFLLFPDNLNAAPVVSSISISPEQGSGSTIFTFFATYFDVQNQLPEDVSVIINEERNTMIPLHTTDSDVTDGKRYSFSTSLPVGTSTYHIEASDGLKKVHSANFSVFVENIGNPPRLTIQVSPETGTEQTNFTFTAIYRDEDNEPPLFVRLKVDDTWVDMIPLVDETSDFLAGKTYVFTTRLQEGVHRFRGRTSDGVNGVLTLTIHAPTVLVGPGGAKPDQLIFERIQSLLLSEFGVNITLKEIKDAVFMGQFVWEVSIDGSPVFISKDGSRLLGEDSFGITIVFVAIAVLIIIAVVLVIIKKRKKPSLLKKKIQ